ncbi:hypothetical protein BS50DRAFT_156960 [Corynespora cassiicola Philippines]|uniref:Uncharacterized protein n=1 Tax=Corynespora cassiicola Philippines TaxID=1448308 RepID=A0A2T2N754_CORCC|nr:hypothetical protein BS50DRAFT_156960 [Corynespora cassiicola Philippines]
MGQGITNVRWSFDMCTRNIWPMFLFSLFFSDERICRTRSPTDLCRVLGAFCLLEFGLKMRDAQSGGGSKLMGAGLAGLLLGCLFLIICPVFCFWAANLSLSPLFFFPHCGCLRVLRFFADVISVWGVPRGAFGVLEGARW